MMEQMRREAGNFGFEYRMLDRDELADMLPGHRPRGRRRLVDPV